MSSSVELIIAEPVVPLHTPFNTVYHERLNDYEQAMIEAAEHLEKWQIEAVGMRYQEIEIKEIRRSVGKRLNTVSEFLDSPECRLLLRIKKEKDGFMDGPSVEVRKNWLATIAEAQLHLEPKEARGAIAELNRMDKTTEGQGGQTLNITINNVLQRGVLDV